MTLNQVKNTRGRHAYRVTNNRPKHPTRESDVRREGSGAGVAVNVRNRPLCEDAMFIEVKFPQQSKAVFRQILFYAT